VPTIVTSPPYWGLRDYGVAGQLGQEPTLQGFIANLVEVFDLCHQLLADDGVLWVNMGDSYAVKSPQGSFRRDKVDCTGTRPLMPPELKQKNLIGQPWRLAFALQDAGWYLRQDIIWHKPNPMPESVRDRCTKSHEYIFMLTKNERYYFDQESILEPVSPNTHARLAQNIQDQVGSERANGDNGAKSNGNMKAVGRSSTPNKPSGWHNSDTYHGATPNHPKKKLAANGSGTKNNESFDAAMAIMPTMRNKRSVWTISTESFKDAHFATFPQELVIPCILAGSRPGDLVFDPFMGSGTVAKVAQDLGRKWIGSELNPEYINLQDGRTRQQGLELPMREVAA
jgi:DNA modification methylase